MKLLFYGHIILLLFCLTHQRVHAQTFPELLTIEELKKDEYLREGYFNQLQMRFKNSDFTEVLNPNHTARSARMNPVNLENTVNTVTTYMEAHPDQNKLLQVTPDLETFSIGSNGEIKTLDPSKKKLWSQIDQKASSLQKKIADPEFLNNLKRTYPQMAADIEILNSTPGKIISQRDLQEHLIQSVLKQFNRDRKAQTLQEAADLLLAFELGEKRIKKLGTMNLKPEQKYAVLEDALKKAQMRAKDMKAPGKLIEDILGQSSLAVPRDSFLTKGTTLTPMSKTEAIFKGVGPGECVRNSCNRYIDGLFEDSMHIKVMKDGKEAGYVGIYKTVDPSSGKKFWFVETIQSPYLAGGEAGKVNPRLNSVLKYIQQEALKDGAALALPQNDFNSFNFKEVIADVKGAPEYRNGQKVRVSLSNEQQLKDIETFQEARLKSIDQVIANNSGYTNEKLVNALQFNRGHAVEVNLMQDQPDWAIKRYSEIKSNAPITPIDPKLILTREEKIGHLKNVLVGLEAKRSAAATLQVDLKQFVGIDNSNMTMNQRIQNSIDLLEMAKNDSAAKKEIAEQLFLYADDLKDLEAIAASSKLQTALGKGVISKNSFSVIEHLFEKKSADEMANFLINNKNLFESDDIKAAGELTFRRTNTLAEFLAIETKLKDHVSSSGYLATNWNKYFTDFKSEETLKAFAKMAQPYSSGYGGDQKVVRSLFRAGLDKIDNAEDILKLLNNHTPASFIGSYSSSDKSGIYFEEISSAVTNRLKTLVGRMDADQLSKNIETLRKLEAHIVNNEVAELHASILKKAKDSQQLDALLLKLKLSDVETARILRDGDLTPLMKNHFEKWFQTNYKNTSLYSLSWGRATDVLNAVEVDNLHHANRGKMLGNVSKSNKIMKPKSAEAFVDVLSGVRKLPAEDQIKVYNVLTKGYGDTFVDLSLDIPSHKPLIKLLNEWIPELQKQGVPDPAKGLKKLFHSTSVNGPATKNCSPLANAMMKLFGR